MSFKRMLSHYHMSYIPLFLGSRLLSTLLKNFKFPVGVARNKNFMYDFFICYKLLSISRWDTVYFVTFSRPCTTTAGKYGSISILYNTEAKHFKLIHMLCAFY